ncbi:uncharacterized protein METZ01_LOCUS357287, partial [marine metagenome]
MRDYINARFKQHNTSRRDYVRPPGRIWSLEKLVHITSSTCALAGYYDVSGSYWT